MLLLTVGVNTQNFYYGPKGKSYLPVSTEKIIVRFKASVNFSTKQQLLAKFALTETLKAEMELPAPNVCLISLSNVADERSLYALLEEMEALPEVEYANHFLVHKDGTLHGILDRVLVKLHSEQQYTRFQSKLKRTPGVAGFSRNEFEPLLIEVIVNGDQNALEFANQLHETGQYAFAEPDFLRIINRLNTTDPSVRDQWSLDNDGVNTSQYGGLPGSDMSVFSAWGTTTGSSNVRVAIIDEGVDLAHPDLLANLDPGFDATGLNSGGAPTGDDAHGTACAAIVAAVGNINLGGAGVAYI